ncbi:MAG: helix-turn-helix transcriptional regulator [Pyrinomonadaceae bacterium]|jgi:transcriptional regulator with XRE-family HTH domain|nr:helix-turn-helix transcriptional regulator [Pyrinomonadaceae bacterium]
MDLLEYVARQIKELRDHYNSGEGLSQEALAAALKVAPNTISRWETATYRPGLEDLEKLARFFGVSIMQFFPPESVKQENDNLVALLRTARQLHPADLEELRKYAEFRRARSIYKGNSRPKAGRKKGRKK